MSPKQHRQPRQRSRVVAVAHGTRGPARAPRRRPPGTPRSPSSPRAAISTSRRCWSARWRRGSSRASSSWRCSTGASTSSCIRSRICRPPSPKGSRIARYCRAPLPPTGCWCGANSMRRARMDCCRSRPARASGASSLRRGALLGQLRAAGRFGAAARQRADATAQARRRPDCRCHRAGGRRPHATRSSICLRSWSSSCRPNGGCRRRGRARWRRSAAPATTKSKRRSGCSPTRPASQATRWEREFLRVIEGGCSTPFGCHVAGESRTPRHCHRARLGGEQHRASNRFVRGIAT